MANLTTRQGDRGQLLIITALGIALLLVLLAMALNTAVFGGVHVASTDDTLHEERTAVQYEEGLERGVRSLIPQVNNDSTGNYTDLRSALDGELSNWTDMTNERYAASGAATTVTLQGVHFRSDVVHDNQSKSFVNANNSTTWNVTEDVEDVERYEINVTNVSDIAPGDCFGKDACFNISVNDGAWVLSIYNKSSEVAVKVDGESECTSTAPATINVTNGSVDGADCFTPFTEDASVTSPYKITYANADNVSGAYNLSADGRLNESNYHSANSSKSPRFDPRLDAATVRFRYRSSELLYRNDLRIEAGEADD